MREAQPWVECAAVTPAGGVGEVPDPEDDLQRELILCALPPPSGPHLAATRSGGAGPQRPDPAPVRAATKPRMLLSGRASRSSRTRGSPSTARRTTLPK